MFIELTDHLRCPAGHEEAFLVLLPASLDGRDVTRGDLGCPVCGRVVAIVDGKADFGGGIPSLGGSALSAEAIATLLGLSGPGGYVALIGGVAAAAPELAALLPDIGLVLVNPPAPLPTGTPAGILYAGRLPLKANSMRGVVVGTEVADRTDWLEAAAAAVLPGLRLVVEAGAAAPPEGVELLAQSPVCWVGKGEARAGRRAP